MITLYQNQSPVKHSVTPSANEGFFSSLEYRCRLQKYLQWAKAPLTPVTKINNLVNLVGI